MVTSFHDALWEPEVADKKLDLIERLVALANDRREKDDKKLTIEIHSEINPLHYFKMVSGDYFRGATEVNPDLDRWSAVLENFARIRQGFKKEEISKAQGRYLSELKETAGLEEIEKESEERERTEEILINLAKECWKDTYLREIGLKLASHPDINKLDDPRHVINQVLDLAEDYYQRLWAISGKDEKMVLFRLCQEGLVSWRSRELVRRLIHRGLIIAAPDFRPLNES
ncbi:MAG: hypothetical protein GWN00_18380, partial [Aliifodinibius sp.]|nr:hypothetical protein [Fodinibius sp.]NIV13035.1 hypothetical protein [Fodinibius sp.]NIY26700.1 hypothetical protein [Fodinibius sp.]